MRFQSRICAWLVMLAILTAGLAGCGGKTEKTEDDGKTKTGKSEADQQSATKSIKERSVGVWDVELVVDGEAAKESLKEQGVPEEEQAAAIEQMKGIFESGKLSVEIRADGTSTSTHVGPDGTEEKEEEKWEVVSEDGDKGKIKLTDAEGERTIEVEFQDADTFLLINDPQLADAPVEPPVFKRRK